MAAREENVGSFPGKRTLTVFQFQVVSPTPMYAYTTLNVLSMLYIHTSSTRIYLILTIINEEGKVGTETSEGQKVRQRSCKYSQFVSDVLRSLTICYKE